MLLQIDDLTRPDHSLICPTDTCYYIREYTSREGYQASVDNQLVFNLKCPLGASSGRLYYKEMAVRQAAMDIADSLDGLQVGGVVFVPLPPSKCSGSPLHDPRVRDMLRKAETQIGIRVVEALSTTVDREAAHVNDERPTVDEVAASLHISSFDWTDARTVVIFDDVLVTGTQFKAAVQVLQPHNPNAEFIGMFWVRRRITA